MNFQEAYWFGTNTSRHQHQNPLASPSNRDPTRPKSMSSNPVSYHHHHIHQVDDEFPDHHDDRQSTTTTSATRAGHDQYYTVDREPMFEKPLTPSDVGKLNRLVIPKQHAEKYFPLNGSGGESAPSGEKGLVLSFEDESGKNWRFRYSYWNSSQSYVLTKGWSRFVKEKRLDAGDVVLFERNRSDLERFFIGWRRRGVGGGNVTASATAAAAAGGAVVFHGEGVVAAPSGSGGGWGGTMWYNARPSAQQQGYPRVTHGVPVANYQQLVAGHEYPHLRTGTYVHNEKAPPAAAAASSGSKNSSKRKLRLFGVNLECHLDVDADYSPEPQTSDASSLSSGGGAPDGGGGGGGASAGRGSGSRSTAANNPATAYFYYDYVGYPSSNHHHMDISFPQDIMQMRNRGLR